MDARDLQTPAHFNMHKGWWRAQRKIRLAPLLFIISLTAHADSCGRERDLGLDEQEFLCDEASARIKECCGQWPGIYCTRSYGCVHKGPELTKTDSLCIRESRCEAIQSAGICQITMWSIYSGALLDGSDGSPVYIALRALSCR